MANGPSADGSVTLFTIGHSSRPLELFLSLLIAHGLRGVVDVRRLPHSKRHPHFDQAALAKALADAGVGYRHAPDLGGMRQPMAGSPNTAWREPAFQGYADHMRTPAFERALLEVIDQGRRERIALMCAEASPSSCHRSLIADALVARGHRVEHILDAAERVAHPLRSEARVVNGRSPTRRLRCASRWKRERRSDAAPLVRAVGGAGHAVLVPSWMSHSASSPCCQCPITVRKDCWHRSCLRPR